MRLCLLVYSSAPLGSFDAEGQICTAERTSNRRRCGNDARQQPHDAAFPQSRHLCHNSIVHCPRSARRGTRRNRRRFNNRTPLTCFDSHLDSKWLSILSKGHLDAEVCPTLVETFPAMRYAIAVISFDDSEVAKAPVVLLVAVTLNVYFVPAVRPFTASVVLLPTTLG
jgi:hypothetical protein